MRTRVIRPKNRKGMGSLENLPQQHVGLRLPPKSDMLLIFDFGVAKSKGFVHRLWMSPTRRVLSGLALQLRKLDGPVMGGAEGMFNDPVETFPLKHIEGGLGGSSGGGNGLSEGLGWAVGALQ